MLLIVGDIESVKSKTRTHGYMSIYDRPFFYNISRDKGRYIMKKAYQVLLATLLLTSCTGSKQEFWNTKNTDKKLNHREGDRIFKFQASKYNRQENKDFKGMTRSISSLY